MPFPRTWSEELIAEWLQLKGYFVESGVPIGSGQKGGRNEADIIGLKGEDDRLDIFHIEVGSLAGNPVKNAEAIKEKFSEKREKAVKEYCNKKTGFSNAQKPNYKKLYVAVWASGKTMSYLKQQNLPVRELSEFIDNEIKPTIQQWKKKPVYTLPDGMWLLHLMDYLSE